MRQKILILIILISVSLSIQATSCFSLLFFFLDDPSVADIIVVGRIDEDKSEKQFLVPEFGWTEYPSKLEVPRYFDLRTVGNVGNKQGVVGERYFVIRQKTSADNHKYLGRIELVKLSRAERAMKLLAGRKDFPGEINHAWRYCESDNDCLQVKNKCGNSIGVNKIYKKDYLSFLKTTKKVFDCSTKNTPLKKSRSKCEEYFVSRGSGF